MADLQTLRVNPNSSGFAASEAVSASIVTLLDGGAPRVRADQLGTAFIVDVSWSVGPADFDYLCAFYRQATQHGSQAFFINLAIESSQVSQHIAYVVPQTWKLANQSGLTWNLTAQLYVLPLLTDSNDDNSLLASYNI